MRADVAITNHQYANRRRLQENIDISGIEKAGFTVRRLTAYCYRVNERIDLYPTQRRYFDIDTKERGSYTDSILICKQKLRRKS